VRSSCGRGIAGNACALGALLSWIGSIARANGLLKMRMPKTGGFRLARLPPPQGRAVPRTVRSKGCLVDCQAQLLNVKESISHADIQGPTTGPSGATCIPICSKPHGQRRHVDIRGWSHEGKCVMGIAEMPVVPTRPRSCLWAICMHRVQQAMMLLTAHGGAGMIGYGRRSRGSDTENSGPWFHGSFITDW